MEYHGNAAAGHLEASGCVQREVLGFFKDHPFLLVSEGRLATLLCRPPSMVCEAVRELERAGLLARRYDGILLGVEDSLSKVRI